MEPIVIFSCFILLVFAAWFVGTYNRFVKYKNRIEEAWSGIDNYIGRFNTLVESFPALYIARKFGFKKQSYFALDLATQRELPEVEFSENRGPIKK